MPRAASLAMQVPRAGTLYAQPFGMVMFAGTEEDLFDVLKSLIEIAYDAGAAYDAALGVLKEPQVQLSFETFRADHARHVRALSLVLHELGGTIPAAHEPRLRQNADVIASLSDTASILLAMRSNESDITLAYEHALDRDDLDSRLAHLLQDNFDEVRAHRNWIENQLILLGEDRWDDEHQLEYFVRPGSSRRSQNRGAS